MSKTIELVIQRAARAGLLTQETHDDACRDLEALQSDVAVWRGIHPIDSKEFAELQTVLMELDPTNRIVGLAARAVRALRSYAADAAMYRAMRAIATEPDAILRDRMSSACDAIQPEQFFTDLDFPTNEQYDAFAVQLIALANGARNADG